MSRAMTKKEVEEDKAEYADLYRDIRGQFQIGRPSKIVLRHLSSKAGVGGGTEDVATWEEEHFEDLAPDDFTKELLTHALEDSTIFQGVQAYGIFIFRKRKTVHDLRLFLRLEGGQPGGDLQGPMSEGPDERGRQGQIMRHDEAFARMAFQAIGQSQDRLLRALDKSEAEKETLMSGHVRMMETLDKLLDKQAEREWEFERRKKMTGYMDMGIDKLMEMGPMLVAAKLKNSNPELAQAIMQATANPAPQILKAFFQDMEKSPDQAQKVFEAIAQLPNGPVIIQALAQLSQMEKASPPPNPGQANGETKQS